MNRKFIYFINPISGTKNKKRLLDIIEKKTTAQHIPFEILYTNAEGNYSYLIPKIAAEKITDIIICGGDGTVNQITQFLLGADVNVGIIPMGSGNGLAFAAKIPKKITKALQVIFNNNVAYIDGFYINRQFSCMLCGLGFDAQIAHDFARQKKRGLFTYIKLTIKNLFRAKPYAFQIEIENQEMNTEAFFISIANSNQFGNNFTIAPQASLGDGLLDIVIVNKMNKVRLVWSLLKQIYTGQLYSYENKKFQRRKIYYFQLKKIVIQNPQNAPLHIDGEPVHTTTHFEIKIVEKAFRLLQP